MKIFYDVDTQISFMNKDSVLYVPGAESIKPNLKKLTKYAKDNFISVVGSMDIHFGTEEYKERETELQKNGGPFPDHCMYGTVGSLKIMETSLYPIDWAVGLGYHISHELDNRIDEWTLEASLGDVSSVETKSTKPWGIYFEKQSYDVFTNPNFEVFLDRADVKEAIVYGVATDYCVKAAVLGMQEKGIQCYVVEDAIKGVDSKTTKSALEEMVDAGAKFVTTKEVLEGKVK